MAVIEQEAITKEYATVNSLQLRQKEVWQYPMEVELETRIWNHSIDCYMKHKFLNLC